MTASTCFNVWLYLNSMSVNDCESQTTGLYSPISCWCAKMMPKPTGLESVMICVVACGFQKAIVVAFVSDGFNVSKLLGGDYPL